MKKQGDNPYIIIGVLIGIIIILGVLLFFVVGNKDSIEKKSPDGHYYCEVDLKRIECASDFDCNSVNGVCDLNEFNCVPPNSDLELKSPSGADCINIGGNWIFSEN